MEAYLLAFIALTWPHLTQYQRAEARAIVHEIVTKTDGTALEDLELVNFSHEESGFDRTAVNPRSGARGAFQVLGGQDFSAAEALRRLRTQGPHGYCGCVRPGAAPTGHECPDMVSARMDRAVLYRMGFEPPRPTPEFVAGNP